MPRKKLKPAKILMAAGVILTAAVAAPIAAVSVVSVVPPADKCVLYAADVSAKMAAGGVFLPQEKTETLTQTAAPVQRRTVSIDDSEMLSRGELNIPSAANEEPDADDAGGAEPYPESLESHDGAIESVTYGTMGGESYINLAAGQVRNVTSVPNSTLEEESLLPPDFAVERSDEPQILIMHTHETESYEPYARDFYDASFNGRTTDNSKNVSSVGDAIAAELEKAGIAVLHDRTKHDFPSYNGSYDRSRITVQDYLAKYPSIKAVLDIHRDAIEWQDGTRVAAVTEINGKNAAQLMIICGCDDGTMDMPDYMKNFHFACALQRQLEGDFPTLTRPVLFDYRSYNQNLTTGSLLIEVGSHANSLDEAVYTGSLIGKSLVNLFLQG